MDRLFGWMEGFIAASRVFKTGNDSGWFTPETIPSWASFAAAILSAIAAFAAVRVSRQTIVNDNRKEALRLLIEAAAEYDRVRDYLSLEIPKITQEADSLPDLFKPAKESTINSLRMNDEETKQRRDAHYEVLQLSLNEKRTDVKTWQKLLAEAQQRYAGAGRIRPFVEASHRQLLESIRTLHETATKAASAVKDKNNPYSSR